MFVPRQQYPQLKVATMRELWEKCRSSSTRLPG
jgi:hypothetical protein